MQPEIKVETASIRAHARMVDESARMLGEGRAAAGWIRTSNDAYGKIYGWVFTSMLNPQQDNTIGALGLAVDATNGLAELLRAAADDLDRGDEDAAARFGGG
jgi:hypothetical protein